MLKLGELNTKTKMPEKPDTIHDLLNVSRIEDLFPLTRSPEVKTPVASAENLATNKWEGRIKAISQKENTPIPEGVKLKNILPDLDLETLNWPLEETEVRQLDKIAPNLYLKNDGYYGAKAAKEMPYGGNKIRKLNYLLADALKNDCKTVVTFGGLGSHHCLATAMAAEKIGLKSKVLLFDQPVTNEVKENLLRLNELSAEIIPTNNYVRTGIEYYPRIVQRALGGSEYPIFAGGSDELGTLGYVEAAYELKRQIEKGEVPKPDKIVVAVGSNGTMAGISLGLMMAGLEDIKVVGIRVAESHYRPLNTVDTLPLITSGTVKDLMQKSYNFLQKHSKSVPDISEKLEKHTPIIDGNYVGEGYGYATIAGDNAKKFAAKEGLKLEDTYTAKSFAGALDQAQQHPNEKIMFWNTYNQIPLQPLQNKDPANLPTDLQKYFGLKPKLQLPDPPENPFY